MNKRILGVLLLVSAIAVGVIRCRTVKERNKGPTTRGTVKENDTSHYLGAVKENDTVH